VVEEERVDLEQVLVILYLLALHIQLQSVAEELEVLQAALV
jgi:hypothetical protein